MKITVEASVNAPIAVVWSAWTTPADIMQWNAANDEWHTPAAKIDLRPGGKFSYRMEAKDGSMGFDFAGEFQNIIEHRSIEFELDDGRIVLVEFIPESDSVMIRETFEAESVHDTDLQRSSWQAILDNFSKHVASKTV